MKRWCTLVAFIALVIMNVGCDNQNDEKDSNTDDTDVSHTEMLLETSENSTSKEVDISPQDVEIKISNDILSVDKYEILDIENITFEQSTNGDDIILRPLFPTICSDNSIYVISEYYNSAEKENTQNVISSFNVLTKEYEELFSFDFDIGYNPDFIYNGHYFTLPCTYNDDGNLQINIIDYDEKNDVSQIIYQETVTSPYYYADYLSESEMVFLIFPKVDEKTYQRLLKYNLEDSKTSILYENEYIYPEDENNVSENIWTMDTFNGSIFLLNTQVIKGERSWSVVEINSSGNILNRMALTGLYDYHDINCSVNQFVVTEEEYLIQYYDPGNNSNFVAVNRDDESISVKFDKLVPCTLVSPFWVNDRYLIYNTFPDYGDYDKYVYSSDISIYDSDENTFYFLKIPFSPEFKIDKIVSNEKGDVILVVSDETYVYQYLFVPDIISYIE